MNRGKNSSFCPGGYLGKLRPKQGTSGGKSSSLAIETKEVKRQVNF